MTEPTILQAAEIELSLEKLLPWWSAPKTTDEKIWYIHALDGSGGRSPTKVSAVAASKSSADWEYTRIQTSVSRNAKKLIWC